MNANHCQSCGTIFKGKFCYECGEKKIGPNDLSLSKFIAHAIDGFTHFDGKFFLTMRYFLFSPGKLTNEYLAGKRVKLMKVVQLYIVIGILFFLLFKDWDIFFSRLQFMILQNADNLSHFYKNSELGTLQRWLKTVVEAKAIIYNKTFGQMVMIIDGALPDKSKAFAFLMIPWLAVSLFIVSYTKQRKFVAHLVHATHLFSFYLAAIVLWTGGCELICRIFHIQGNLIVALLPVYGFAAIYFFISIKKVLQPSHWIIHIGQFIFVFGIGFFGAIQLYRSLIVVVTTLLA